MKYLSHYLEVEQTKLFADAGAFFAFSNEQLNANKVEGVVYVGLSSGMVCPSNNAKQLIKSLTNCYKKGIVSDMAENGKKAIIVRELHNHEAFYVGDIEDTADALIDYPITKDEILEVFKDLLQFNQ